MLSCVMERHPARCRRAVLRTCRLEGVESCATTTTTEVVSTSTTVTTTTVTTTTILVDPTLVSEGPLPPGASEFYGTFPARWPDMGYFVADHIEVRSPEQWAGAVLGFGWKLPPLDYVVPPLCPASWSVNRNPIVVHQVRANGTELVVTLDPTTVMPIGKYVPDPRDPGCYVVPNPNGNLIGWVLPLAGTGLDIRRSMTVYGIAYPGPVVL